MLNFGCVGIRIVGCTPSIIFTDRIFVVDNRRALVLHRFPGLFNLPAHRVHARGRGTSIHPCCRLHAVRRSPKARRPCTNAGSPKARMSDR